MDWLIEQMDDPEKRIRMFKMLSAISQLMVVIGVLIFAWICKDIF
tara:strand:- start:1339 stop:1473 length:135 start_codon:yes stop_codon:yes gene_type:complete